MKRLSLPVLLLSFSAILIGCDPDSVTQPTEPAADTLVLTLERDKPQMTVGVNDTIAFSGTAVANSAINVEGNTAYFALTIGVCDSVPANGLTAFRPARLGVDAQLRIFQGDLSYTDTSGYDQAVFIQQLPNGHSYPVAFQVIPLINGTFMVKGGAGTGSYLLNRYDARTETRHASGDLHHRLHQGNGEDTLLASHPGYQHACFFTAQ